MVRCAAFAAVRHGRRMMMSTQSMTFEQLNLLVLRFQEDRKQQLSDHLVELRPQGEGFELMKIGKDEHLGRVWIEKGALRSEPPMPFSLKQALTVGQLWRWVEVALFGPGLPIKSVNALKDD
jgi:hypothetical protein